MSQFLFKGVEHGAVARKTNRKLESGFRNDSVAYLHFFFERQTGYFLLQVPEIRLEYVLLYELFRHRSTLPCY